MTKAAIAAGSLLTLGIFIGRFTVPPVARAQSGCSLGSLKGSYSLAVNGFFYDQDGVQGVYGSAGLVVADGAGGITGTDTVNVDGTPTRGRQFTGVYTVNADCSGTMNLKDSSGAAITNMDMAIANGGKDVALADYDANLILNGAAKLQ